ncbi:ATP-dependent helicase [Spiroplasma tabanidicola]|uniref:DNA 3'-5' helicase n=1 Tax=Spiroplasma tabanidicola TaxID=324079 RepID=A0A6I6C9H5_9MOLU|nr:UvrD-helicase domain-containing protein [Spiroplasma tabanidicola]QGS51551.1 ATP-dependent DNA helicase [Spiroplasma tabanidicola]
MHSFLEGLNDNQLESIITTDVPLRVIAGAGSGKTRVITNKIAYLVEQEQINPFKILAVTFTNKAANEMKNRIKKISHNKYTIPHIMTFHAFCVRVLREDYELLNLKKDFVIIDTSEQEKIIRKLLKTLNLDDSKNKPERKIISKISKWKSSFVTWDDAYESSFNPTDKSYAKVYRDYEDYLKENGYVDFDDLLLKVHALLKYNIETRKKWINRFSYILVDEFQDTNNVQYDLIKWLTDKRGCLTVVGDPDQTIYSWRGAKVNIILNFEREFQNARTILLDQNYRSTKPILDLANSFIQNNKNREDKNIYTQKKEGEKVEVKECATKYFEAKYIAKKIEELVKNHKYAYSDIFVLYRINAWSVDFEKEFANSKIPFQLVGGFQFRDRKVIKDVTALLKAIAIKDNFSFERVFSFVPKVGAVTADRLFNCAEENDLNMFELLTQREDLVAKISKHLGEITNVLRDCNQMFLDNKPVVEIASYAINKSGYKERLDLKDKDGVDSSENLNAYLDQMRRFDNDYEANESDGNRLIKFLQEETLNMTSEDIFETPNKVTLMTIHAAKGLENKVIFIVGLSSDVFPSRMSMYSKEGLEEERRTFYVAITRAQERLYISYVSGEYSYLANGEFGPSRFINELDPNLYSIEKSIFFHSSTEMSSKKYDSGVVETVPQKLDAGVKTGEIIEHLMFGEGVVNKIMDKYIQVSFSNPAYGTKLIPISSNSWNKK